MSRQYSLKGTGIAQASVLSVAVLAQCDPRSVKAEIRAQLGEGDPVRGSVGERIRTHLKTLGLPPKGAKVDVPLVHARKKVRGAGY